MSMMGGTASVPGRGNSRLRLRSPASIAVYDTYEDAQHAVDYLADRNFPVQFLSIVGTDLKSIERITGGLSWGRVLASAAMNGLVWGSMAALLFYFFVPNVSIALVLLGAIVVFVLANVLTSGISYAMTAGRRDFTSSSQIVATRYEVIGENEVAGQARQLLTGGRPARTVHGSPVVSRPGAGWQDAPQGSEPSPDWVPPRTPPAAPADRPAPTGGSAPAAPGQSAPGGAGPDQARGGRSETGPGFFDPADRGGGPA